MIVLLSADLMLVAAAQGAAERHGVKLVTATGAESFAATADDAVQAAIVDLRLPGLAIGELVPKLRERFGQHAAIVACGPHVHRDALAAAAAAGCDEVITRGEFERRIDSLARELTAQAASRERPG